jgi:hypothetical protein
MLSALATFAVLVVAQPSGQSILEGAFSGAVRAALVPVLSGQSSDFSNKWGSQLTLRTPDGGHWEWEGVHSHWVTHYREDNVNHGLWTRGNVQVENPQQELVLNFSDFRTVPGHYDLTFKVFIRMLFRGHVEARQYNHGAELLAVDSNMRAVGKANLSVRVYLSDNATRLGWNVIATDLQYSDVTVDRVGVIGGFAARVLGDAARGTINQFFAKKKNEILNNAKNAISQVMSRSLPIRNDVTTVIRTLAH